MIPPEQSALVARGDLPRRPPVDRSGAVELIGSVGAAFALVWTPFHLAGWDAPFGFTLCWLGAFATIYGILVRQRHGLLVFKDRMATVFIAAGTSAALLPLFLILYYVAIKGVPAVFAAFPHFLTHDMRRAGPIDPLSKAGMQHAIIGTLEQVGLAGAVSVPLGILTATYLNEVGGRFAAIVRAVADAMTGLPSIIAGLLVYTAWVKPRHTHGQSGLAAAMALAVVMLPTIVRTAEEVLRIVSSSLREAALALGAPEWRMVVRVVLPTARTGLVTAALLGIARAVGETAPVLLTTGGTSRTNGNPLNGPQSDLPLQIYEYLRNAEPKRLAEAWGGALLLVVIILTLFTLARILGASGGGRRRPLSR